MIAMHEPACLVVVFVVGALAVPASAALACPLCVTEGGTAVRAAIRADFALHLVATVAPFPVLGAIVALLHRGWRPWSSRHGA